MWRLDGGFGSDDALNWLLSRDYQLIAKGYNSRRAQKLVRQIASEVWQTLRDNKWVAVVPKGVRYARRTQTLALRLAHSHLARLAARPRGARLRPTWWQR